MGLRILVALAQSLYRRAFQLLKRRQQARPAYLTVAERSRSQA